MFVYLANFPSFIQVWSGLKKIEEITFCDCSKLGAVFVTKPPASKH